MSAFSEDTYEQALIEQLNGVKQRKHVDSVYQLILIQRNVIAGKKPTIGFCKKLLYIKR